MDIGHWILDTGHRTPDTGHRTPDTGHWTLDTEVRTWICVRVVEVWWDNLGGGRKYKILALNCLSHWLSRGVGVGVLSESVSTRCASMSNIIGIVSTMFGSMSTISVSVSTVFPTCRPYPPCPRSRSCGSGMAPSGRGPGRPPCWARPGEWLV